MSWMKTTVSSLITLYVSVPVLLFVFPWIVEHIIFAHLLTFPFFVDLSRPEDLLNNTYNFYLSTEEDISVGVWHTLPASQWEQAVGKSPEWYQRTLGDGSPVIIYLHGNGGNRAMKHRVELMKIMSAADYHVLSLDYRGFGDSTGEPSEAGLTTDALYLYQWVKQQSRDSFVCLWGHSLGSGVATNVAVKLQEQGSAPDAVILQGAFTNMEETIFNHPITKLYLFLPGFESLMWNILGRNNVVFANDENVKTLTSPFLILHAEDDNIIPYHMGLQLYKTLLQTQEKHSTEAPVEMISYRAELGFSHNRIYLDPNLSNVVKGFLRKLRLHH
ncbi:monoacylglycerol lipase ABHD12 [Cynoglossus semilaevis]|uniref:Abhydrolase domain containing 12B n=1 Tax=Cynoglossus semilaevis TaxID=244447 RepID=A0A3P8VC84_CYNSE|nr:protein ABHD12B [Cynoglossus semilaevis]XP_016889981.1 protein ABHD12B [Cynoglossus semilaevis]